LSLSHRNTCHTFFIYLLRLFLLFLMAVVTLSHLSHPLEEQFERDLDPTPRFYLSMWNGLFEGCDGVSGVTEAQFVLEDV
jgi:hypothetical protein